MWGAPGRPSHTAVISSAVTEKVVISRVTMARDGSLMVTVITPGSRF